MRTPAPKTQRISSERAGEILARARDENWTHLALLGPPWHLTLPEKEGWKPDRIYLLDKPLTNLPASIGRLKDLRFLALAFHCLSAEGARALPGLTSLTSLNLRNTNLGDGGARALAGLTSLTSLDLRNNNLGDEGARALAGLTSLTSLNLWGNNLGDEGARALAGFTRLASLNLGGNNLGAEGARALASVTRLTSLDLWNNNLGAEGARALAGLSRLTSLDLGNNDLGAEGARALAGLTSLTSLDLGHNNLGEEGARALAVLTSLTSLDLDYNNLGAEGARALAGLTSLTSLELGFNELGDEGARALAALTGLTSLDLRNNNLGDEGARALAALTGLTSLNLRNNNVGPDGARALAGLTSLTSLNLGNNNLGADGARALAGLTSLTSLNLGNNNLGADGARALAGLTSLTSLNLGNNNLGADGARTLAGLTSLTSLDLWNNSLGDEGARALAGLTSLTWLDLGNNNLGAEGARALAGLTSLTSLNLDNNNLGAEGARALAGLASLTSLDLDNNNLGAEGARALAGLTSLASLSLGNNNLGAVGARALAGLTSLISLYLQNNNLGDEGVDSVLRELSSSPTAARLTYLDVSENGVQGTSLPLEMLASRDAQAILAAYRRYHEAGKQPLNEAKLLVLGKEAVGKTSLIRYLVHNQPRDPSEQKTQGAHLHEKIETQTWSTTGSPISLNIWDFGGQEIYHHTHRFFLTERSLYLLVVEARREDDSSVYDWLKTILNRGGASPVIVVINKHEPPQDLQLDEKGIKKDYPNVIKFVRTSCNPGEKAEKSIVKLRELIAKTLEKDERLQHIRDPLPASWLRVKHALTELAKQQRVLTLRDFERLCEQGNASSSAISDAAEQRALLRLLHDLGVVVAHGLRRDDAALREITLLDPNWLTGGIYRLLTSDRIKDHGGEFARKELSELLDPKDYPPERHEFILKMMEDPDIGLCFPLPDSNGERFLIPEGLPKNEPDYDLWPPDSLRFRFDYAFLPPGLIPRFIVQAHRNLTEHPTRWRTGVVLGAAQCKILVRGDRAARRIDIQVSGPANLRRSALNIVLDDLDEVHKLNPEVHPKAMVPLTDEPNLAVSYEHLLTIEKRYDIDRSFDPDGASRPYTVRELLEGLRWEKSARDKEALGEDYENAGRSRGKTGRRAPATRAKHQSPSEPVKRPSIVYEALGLLAGVAVLALTLSVVWSITQSTVAFIAIGAVAVLLVLAVFALVAANAKILKGTQLERILQDVLKKVPQLGLFLGGKREKHEKNE
jgi:small GTP-binding protein